MPELTGRELDAAVAREVFGREILIVDGQYFMWAGSAKRHSWKTHAIDYDQLPQIANCVEHAYIVEAEIGRKGLIHEYVQALAVEVIGFQPKPPDTEEQYAALRENTWRLLRATPEQTCRAALKAVREAADAQA